ncbi:MAG: AsmA-like C-terminal region-containing protein, partial [Cyanobacteria bacterium]|nr:AsmA-like C-terminal region-containing protein [Cyanobacteriota bacterium]
TNGLLHVNLENGRLPAITKVESLLTAANILRGGLIGLNLNNIINSLRPYETNNFTKMTGDFEMTSGVVYTENLSSKGQNLDLEIKGNIKLVDGTADLVVKGAMSQDVAGILGTLGKLSVTKIFQFIPGLGYIPGFKRRGGILSLIPGVGYVPGFGGPAKDINHFTVKIKGPLEQNSSVKDLDWN